MNERIGRMSAVLCRYEDTYEFVSPQVQISVLECIALHEVGVDSTL